MIINTNVSSLLTRNYLRQNNDEMEKAMERLSSGKRLNNAGDDAAGLAISTRMTTQVRGMNMAERNANDGISLLQTAEAAMGSISDILQRIRELSVQADNGTYSADDKTSLQNEVSKLLEEANHIATTTNFNGINLLDGSVKTVNLHISDLATDVISVALNDLKTATLSIDAINVSTNAQEAITKIDSALDTISTNRSAIGATQNRLEFTIENLNVAGQNVTASRSRIEDADMAEESSNLTRADILNQTAISMLSKANESPQGILNLLK